MVSDLQPGPLNTCFCELLPQGLGSCYFLPQELPLTLPNLQPPLLLSSPRLRLNLSYATEQQVQVSGWF